MWSWLFKLGSKIGFKRLAVGGLSASLILAFLTDAHLVLLVKGLQVIAPLLAKVADAAGLEPAAVAGMADILATANIVVPVYEIFSLAVALVAIKAAAAAYRFVKSWIPTMSGS